MKFKNPIGTNITGLLQPAIQIKGGLEDIEEFLFQIEKMDETFDSKAYLKKHFIVEDKPIKSKTIHLK